MEGIEWPKKKASDRELSLAQGRCVADIVETPGAILVATKQEENTHQ